MLTENIPHLGIESNDNGTITLEQDCSGNVDRVTVHPIHLRLMAERLGLIERLDANNEQPTLAEQARDLNRLKRYMLRVREHSLQLQHLFKTTAPWDHADLTFELGLINTLVDLLDMAVDDFVDDFKATDPEPYKPRDKDTQRAPAGPVQLELGA